MSIRTLSLIVSFLLSILSLSFSICFISSPALRQIPSITYSQSSSQVTSTWPCPESTSVVRQGKHTPDPLSLVLVSGVLSFLFLSPQFLFLFFGFHCGLQPLFLLLLILRVINFDSGHTNGIVLILRVEENVRAVVDHRSLLHFSTETIFELANTPELELRSPDKFPLPRGRLAKACP